MTRKRKPKNQWTPLAKAYINETEARATFQENGLDWDPSFMVGASHWLNDKYQVEVRRFDSGHQDTPGFIWLSIKRIDRNPVRDWRDFQRIKNELVGKDYEGVELYPAESRLVDTANQYHIWVVNDPQFRFPFGFEERLVMDAHEAKGKAKQRKLPEPDGYRTDN